MFGDKHIFSIVVVQINNFIPTLQQIRAPIRVLIHRVQNYKCACRFLSVFFYFCVLTDIFFKLPNFTPNSTKIDPNQMCAQMKTCCAQYKMTSHQEKWCKNTGGGGREGGGRRGKKDNVPEHRKIN